MSPAQHHMHTECLLDVFVAFIHAPLENCQVWQIDISLWLSPYYFNGK